MILLCGLQCIRNQAWVNSDFELCIETTRAVPMFAISVIFFTLITTTDPTGTAMAVIVH